MECTRVVISVPSNGSINLGVDGYTWESIKAETADEWSSTLFLIFKINIRRKKTK